MTPSENKHDPYTQVVSYESTPSGDHNMSICRQGKKPTSRTFSPNRGRVRNFTPGIICSADHSAQKKNLENFKKVRKPLPTVTEGCKVYKNLLSGLQDLCF